MIVVSGVKLTGREICGEEPVLNIPRGSDSLWDLHDSILNKGGIHAEYLQSYVL